ncbi:hypothetical protein IRJ41_008897, partial [Triplophysa rosa]
LCAVCRKGGGLHTEEAGAEEHGSESTKTIIKVVLNKVKPLHSSKESFLHAREILLSAEETHCKFIHPRPSDTFCPH